MRDGTNGPQAGSSGPSSNAARARWLAILAQAPKQVLKEAWGRLEAKPDYRLIRAPETGLALVRGRIGGVGQRFNIGEMSLCRCSLAVDDGQGGEVAGHGYVAGCDQDHALYVALFDGLMQLPPHGARLESDLIAPQEKTQADAKRQSVETAQASRVEFFTMVRGE
ncbi:MAG: phosphonate C-P lyase system protein PhnG [Rhodospirillales bacterium]|jgi:alpha-D-ribose 1-methylphosphonate 5-triphosphate synthase subunit PhnG|nr:phosphonate C-P lyase system protein PhnG [Rhodospirillales bacterium]